MTADERIALLRVRIDRAKEHLIDLEAEVNLFLDGLNPPPYESSVRRDPQTQELLYYIVSVRQVPERISVLAGDVIQNCRSVLDHLACQFFLVNNPGKKVPAHVSFPIFEDASTYDAKKVRKVRGMRPDAMGFIDGLKPYKGGHFRLWEIHKLNNIDKHRLLLTVACSNQGRSITEIEKAKLFRNHPAQDAARIRYIAPERDQWNVPPEASYVFHGGPADSEEDKNTKIGPEITFHEPDVMVRESLIETLEEFLRSIENIVMFGCRRFLA